MRNEDPTNRLDEFEVVWATGVVDRFKASQVSWPPPAGLFGEPRPEEPRLIRFHGVIEGSWTLVLQAREEDILSVRNLSQAGDLA